MNPLLHTLLELGRPASDSGSDDSKALKIQCNTEIGRAVKANRVAKIELGKGHVRYLVSDTQHSRPLERGFYAASFQQSVTEGNEATLHLP